MWKSTEVVGTGRTIGEMNQMMKMKHGKQMPERKNRRLALEETKTDASLRIQSSKPELDSGTFDFRERDRISYNFSLLFCPFIDLKSTRQWHHGTLCTKSFAHIHEQTNAHWLLLFFSFQIQMEMD